MGKGGAYLVLFLIILTFSTISIAEDVVESKTITILRAEDGYKYKRSLSPIEIKEMIEKHLQFSGNGLRGRVVFSRDKKTNAKTFYVNIEGPVHEKMPGFKVTFKF